ncbi:MAG: cysteine synthase A [Actinobacteria bacterium]|nr:cysteine synthase A [Actinomycetota bacterium]
MGRTPLVRLKPTRSGQAAVFAKIESANPGGSVKDRLALALIEDAEKRGVLAAGGAVVEATSGNTGIGLAIACAVRGYRLILVLPESMSAERIAYIQGLGAEVMLSPADGGMAGSIHMAEAVAESVDGFIPRQFDNPANPAIHEATTGPEILAEIPAPDAFVAGVGTGGTITGVARAFRTAQARALIVAVEPTTSPVLSGGHAGPHRIQGIGAGFVPAVLDRDLLDEIITVDDLEAWNEAGRLARTDGLFVGVSSGAASLAAFSVADRLGEGSNVVTLFPDTGERYVSLASYFDL